MSNKELAEHMRKVLRERKETPQETFQRLLSKGFINREGKLTKKIVKDGVPIES